MDHLSLLNEKQREAVFETEGYLRVIAGAGSGKTKLLVSRYAYLVCEYGIDPANILCVTFTNKAAGEMKRRVRALIGEEYDTSLICTYHGFCVRVLREDIEKLFYPKQFQIIDTACQKEILADVYQKFELKLDRASFEKIMKLIGLAKADRRYVSQMCCRDKCQILPSVVTLEDQIIEEYMQRQKQIYAMDFDDLIYFTLDLFHRCPEVLQKWQDRLNYVQVDEFQDSATEEMELIDLISAKYKNLMIVGDPDQNIYEWRGSDVSLLVDFDKHHVPTKTVFLNQNYRSTPEILRCANTLIENNVYRLKKELFTKSGEGAPVYHYHLKNEYAEADAIIENINSLRKSDSLRFCDFAVLYRSAFLSRVIEKKFTENGIPYEIFGGVKFYQRMEIQDIMAYLRLVAFGDDVSFKRVVNKPRRRFGRAKLARLSAIAGTTPLYDTLKANLEDPALRQSAVAPLCNMIEGLRAEEGSLSLSEIVERVCDESGYEKYIRELGDMERFDNLSEFKRIAYEYENSFGEEVSLAEFISHIALQSEDDGEEAADMVKLMTIHAAKGLEFPVVFVMGFTEGIFPSAKTIEERKIMGLEEERRLCYVAITRAERRLFLTDSEGYTQNEKQKLPSRFLREIGEENYIRIGTISKELRDSAEDYARSLTGEPQRKRSLEVGQTVDHPAFGKGRIVSLGKNGTSYKVYFEKINGERDISRDFFLKEKRSPITVPEPDPAPEPTEKPEPPPSPSDDTKKAPDGYLRAESHRVPVIKSAGESETEIEKPARPDTKDHENLWEDDTVPKEGWSCVGITDLGEPSGVCEMCGHQIIRYVHHMVHQNYRPLGVGCICAGRMEGDVERAKRREQEYKNRESRRETFRQKKWKTSKSNNSYLKIRERLVVLFFNQKSNTWKYSIDNVFCRESYGSREEAVDAVFEALERLN